MKVLAVEKLVPGGYGLARTEEGAVLIKGALPGEVCLLYTSPSPRDS